MPRFRTCLALAALIAAASPLAAQNATTHYDAGSFTLDVPQGVRLARTHATNAAAFHSESFTGGGPEQGAVMVVHSSANPGPGERMLADTSLAARTTVLRANREVFRRGSRTITLAPDAREIATANRVTLRSPATMQIGPGMEIVGTADVSVPRAGTAEIWVVLYANRAGTPNLDTAAARVLDSFQITGRPTTAPLQQQE